MVAVTVNGTPRQLDVPPDMPLLWAVREALGLTGTKYGCGMALCGACTVHVDGAPARACVTPASAVAGKQVTTIEGLSAETDHPVQRAWIEIDVPQCGYCQSGQIMSAAALLAQNKTPSDQLPHLPDDADRRGPGDRGAHPGVGAAAGGARRAGRADSGAGRLQRDLRGHGQTRPPDATQPRGSALELIARPDLRSNRRPSFVGGRRFCLRN